MWLFCILNPHLLPPSLKGDVLDSGLFGNHKAVPHILAGKDSSTTTTPLPSFQSLVVPVSEKDYFCSVRINGNAAPLPLKLSRSYIFVRGVLIHQVSKQDIVKSGCFLQLSNHLSTCGLSHIYYFCGRRGCACGNMKKCVWGGERQLIL